MNQTLRNILAVIIGALIGSVVNGFIVNISGSIITLPEGANVASMPALNDSMPLFEPKNFLGPFLAHAIGTLVGALIAALIGVGRKLQLALIVGGLFFLGGAYMVYLLDKAPLWFNATDLIFAYFPMAWLGYKIATIGGKK